MKQCTSHAPVNMLTDVGRPAGVEIAIPTRYSIPVFAVLTLDAYDDPTIAEVLLGTSEKLRLTFDGVLDPTTEGSFIGTWDSGTLVGATLAARGSSWDNAPDGPLVVDLVIDPEYRRRGAVMALIIEVAGHCKDWGSDSLALRIDGRHLEAAGPYDGLGFKEID